MSDRRIIGDLAIAFFLAFPTVALSRPQPTEAELHGVSNPVIERAADASRTTAEKRADIEAE